MKKILIIMGHPSTDSLCGALAKKYFEGAESGGGEVKIINIGELKFDPILREGYKKIQKLEPDLVGAQKDILWAEHLVFIHPVWWGTMPALTKGFIDRIFLPGFAFKYKGIMPIGLLKGRSCRLIITTGSPWIFYKILGSLAEKLIKRGIFGFCGIKPIKSTLFCAVENAPAEKQKKWMKKVFLMGKNGR